ncbi:hypothetical protein [Alicyclobacillus ferrooxydans]|uniref:Uncharacterized protein n=1 Tax=Alicyclobacillus ferrooxydans TaxID=471514 RepID=A0A0P9CX10_9BACL|nr:hypothetical protein [Alicyclobacillus ferrooxydans]KPV44303.1 hypothetical protein AN477_07815 [Alicyclobacillus ferrooxydans]
MRTWVKIGTITGIPAAALVTFGIVTVVHASSPMLNGHSAPAEPQLTQSQIDKVASTIQDIVMPDGYFVRTSNPPQFRSDQITHSKAEALHNPNIQEIILPYGTFVRAQQPTHKQN